MLKAVALATSTVPPLAHYMRAVRRLISQTLSEDIDGKETRSLEADSGRKSTGCPNTEAPSASDAQTPAGSGEERSEVYPTRGDRIQERRACQGSHHPCQCRRGDRRRRFLVRLSIS